MKIQFSPTLTGSMAGPGSFTNRLVDYLRENYPVKIVRKRPDIYLGAIVASRGIDPKVKRVFRVDGCYYSNESSRVGMRNRSIYKGMKNQDGIIYQSNFSKKMCRKILGCRKLEKKTTVIYNGFDQSIVNDIKPIEKDCDLMFVSSAKWRTSKRPNSIIKGFLEADIPDSKLYLLGDSSNHNKYKNVISIPYMKKEELYAYYKASDAMIHLCFIDSCPNSVIEALSFNLPVICNNIGGTPEIVRDSGVIVECDSYNFNIIDKVIDNIPPKMTAEAIRKFAYSDRTIVDRKDLDMSVAAKKYYEFFTEILNG